MDKRIKVLAMFNCASYLLMLVMIYINTDGSINNLNNITKFIIGSAPFLLIICTSFVCTDWYFKDFKFIKKEAILDLSIRIISFLVVMYGLSCGKNIFMEFEIILTTFIFNCVIEYLINKKIISSNYERESEKKIDVTFEEKNNLRAMMIATNKSMLSVLVFCAISLSVPVTKNIEGTTENWFIPVIFSVFVFTWFIKASYKNYNGFYLDKNYAKQIFIRNIIFASIGYAICLVLSFFRFNNQAYGFIEMLGIAFLFPTINTMRKMSHRLKEIRDSLGKDTYNYFLIKKNK